MKMMRISGPFPIPDHAAMKKKSIDSCKMSGMCVWGSVFSKRTQVTVTCGMNCGALSSFYPLSSHISQRFLLQPCGIEIIILYKIPPFYSVRSGEIR
jgi:hypothetical protein